MFLICILVHFIYSISLTNKTESAVIPLKKKFIDKYSNLE